MRPANYALAALLFLALLAASVLCSVAFVRFTAPIYVSFDLRGTVDSFTEQSAQQPLSDDARERLVAQFSVALDRSLVEYQAQHHAVILVSSAVVAGAPDITAQIQESVAQKMRAGAEP